MDLFKIIFDAFSPYAFAILKLALAVAWFRVALQIIRTKNGSYTGTGVNNPLNSAWLAFMGYLIGRGIPVILGITDRIVDTILQRLTNGG